MYLVTSAIEDELEPLRKAISRSPQVELQEVGVGLVQAAIGIDRLLDTLDDVDAVLFVGSSGSYSKEMPLGHCVLSSDVSLGCPWTSAEAYFLEIVKSHLAAPEPLLSHAKNALPDLALVPVFCPLGISRIKAGTPVRAVENLELFSIAYACEQRNIPWLGITCITNLVGPDAHSEWLANQTLAAEHTAERVITLVNNLLRSR